MFPKEHPMPEHSGAHMRHIRLLTFYVLLITSLAACSSTLPTATPTIPVLSEIAREGLTIDLGDFQTKAELTYPADGDETYPTVILLHGSAAADMDYHRYSSWGERSSSITVG